MRINKVTIAILAIFTMQINASASITVDNLINIEKQCKNMGINYPDLLHFTLQQKKDLLIMPTDTMALATPVNSIGHVYSASITPSSTTISVSPPTGHLPTKPKAGFVEFNNVIANIEGLSATGKIKELRNYLDYVLDTIDTIEILKESLSSKINSDDYSALMTKLADLSFKEQVKELEHYLDALSLD